MGEGVADEGGVDVAGGVEGRFEGEDDEHLRDALLDPAEAAALPGPELGGDEPEDGDVAAVEFAGEAEVDVGEVDEDGGGGVGLVDVADEPAELGVDVGGVAEDFGDAHVGDVFGADDAGLAGGLHEEAAETGEGGLGESLFQGVDDLRAVEIARGFAGGEKEVRVGVHAIAWGTRVPWWKRICQRSLRRIQREERRASTRGLARRVR